MALEKNIIKKYGEIDRSDKSTLLYADHMLKNTNIITAMENAHMHVMMTRVMMTCSSICPHTNLKGSNDIGTSDLADDWLSVQASELSSFLRAG